MSGLDTSQALTDDASLHAAEYHLHSHPDEPEKWTETAHQAKAEVAASDSAGEEQQSRDAS